VKWRSFAAAVGAALVLPTFAWAAADSAADAIEVQKAQWSSRFREAREAVVEARRRHAEALDAYKQARHHRRERGVEKAKVLEELAASAVALEEAEIALEELFEPARRAGVPPGWIRMERDKIPAAPEPSPDVD